MQRLSEAETFEDALNFLRTGRFRWQWKLRGSSADAVFHENEYELLKAFFYCRRKKSDIQKGA